MHETDSRAEESIHKSVLLHEVLEGLDLSLGDIALDGTINGGGHSVAICQRIGRNGVLLGMDLDQRALERAKKRLSKCESTLILENANYRSMADVASKHGIVACNAILLDLGFSSDQLEHSGRGFSFKLDEPLLLTLSDQPEAVAFRARDIVNEWEEEHIADVLYGYGEERFARRIAKRIVEYRADKKIETTKELAEIVRHAVPQWYRFGRIHPATKTFQALRIAVNDEIESLREGLKSAFELCAPGGRIAVISFHSIEDRIVKRAFESMSREGKGVIITKKPITATPEEIKENPRSRSAKLRIFEVAQN